MVSVKGEKLRSWYLSISAVLLGCLPFYFEISCLFELCYNFALACALSIHMILWQSWLCTWWNFETGTEGRGKTEGWISNQVWNQLYWWEIREPWWSSICESCLWGKLEETWYRLHWSLLPTSNWYSCTNWSHGLILSLCFGFCLLALSLSKYDIFGFCLLTLTSYWPRSVVVFLLTFE